MLIKIFNEVNKVLKTKPILEQKINSNVNNWYKAIYQLELEGYQYTFNIEGLDFIVIRNKTELEEGKQYCSLIESAYIHGKIYHIAVIPFDVVYNSIPFNKLYSIIFDVYNYITGKILSSKNILMGNPSDDNLIRYFTVAVHVIMIQTLGFDLDNINELDKIYTKEFTRSVLNGSIEDIINNYKVVDFVDCIPDTEEDDETDKSNDL